MTKREREKTERWVKQLNKLGRELDEQARGIHPAAWSETLGPNIRRYKELAQKGSAR